LPIFVEWFLNESYQTNITYFRVTGAPLRPRDYCYGRLGSTADDVTNVNFGFKQFVPAVGIYAASDSNKSFMTMDNISIMCRNSLLCCVLTWSVSKVQIFFYLLLLTAVNMYKHRGKVVFKILQGSVVTQTMLGGLAIYFPVANFL